MPNSQKSFIGREVAIMALPTVDEFSEILRNEPADDVARNYVFGGDIFLAQKHPNVLKTLRNHLCPEFRLEEENVVIVGSAKMGFSLDPYSFPSAFKKKGGDIDIVVVSQELFDTYWEIILKWHYPRRTAGLNAPDREWVRDRRKDLYWGWFHPSEIGYVGLSLPTVLKPLRDIKTRWFNSFQSLSMYSEFSGRAAHGRLYRTWDHALWYHVSGLNQIKSNLT